MCPKRHEHFCESQVPLLVVCGENDTIFSKERAMAYLRDLAEAEVHILDAGHSAVKTETQGTASLMLSFSKKHDIQ